MADPIHYEHPHAAFAYRDFRMFFAARLSNNLGTGMMLPALGWQIYALTGSALSLGLLGLASFIPSLLATLPAGYAADHLERRNSYRFAQLGLVLSGVTLFLLTVTGVRNPLFYFVAIGIYGAGKTFSVPASTAWMPHLIPRVIFPSAVGWTSSAFQLAAVAGPSIAGFCLALGGEAATYAVAACLYFGSFLFASLVRTQSRGSSAKPSELRQLFGGFGYIRSNRLILGATTLDLFAVMLGGATAMLPVYAHDILHVDEAGFGLLRSAPAIGAATTALILAHQPLRRSVGPWMFGAVAIYGLATICFGLSTSFLLSVIMLVTLGVADMVGAFLRSTLVQLSTHDDMRGRVSSISMFFGSARSELGDMQSGFLASLVGVPTAVAFGGFCAVAVAGIWAWRFPELRRTDRLVPDPARVPREAAPANRTATIQV